MISLKKYYFKNKFLPVAHRGDSRNAPENTISAFQQAIESGIPAIEVDVHITKDDYIVAFHDETLEKKTTIQKPINETTFTELEKIEVGSWFNPSFANEQIPRLEQILELIHNKVYLILEMKPFSTRPSLFVEKVVEILRNYHYVDKTLIVSFDYNLLKLIRQIDKNYNIGAIKIPGSNLLPSDLKYLTQCDAVICSINELDDNFNNNAKLHKIPIGVYDVDNQETFSKALSYKVQGIGTNNPKLIMNLLRIKQ